MKDVIREGNPLLKEKSVDVQIPLSKEDEELIISMMEYVYNSCDPEYNEKYDAYDGDYEYNEKER